MLNCPHLSLALGKSLPHQRTDPTLRIFTLNDSAGELAPPLSTGVEELAQSHT